MRSIFWRIFLWFWLALVTLLGAALLLTQVASDQRLRALDGVDPRQLSAQACEALALGGVAGLGDWVKRQARTHDTLDIFVMTPAGDDLLQRRLPGRLLDWDRYLRNEGHLSVQHAQYAVAAACRPRLGEQWLSATSGVRSEEFSWAWRETPELQDIDGRRFRLIYEPSYYPPVAPGEFLALGGRFFWAVLLLGLLGSAALCWALARHISVPVKTLQAGVREIADGHLQQRAPRSLSRRHDEIGALARDFDRMAGQVGELIDDKHLLLRNVAHELRSPLARLHLAVTLARRKDDSLDRQLDRVEREGERLNRLIGELLRFDRLAVRGLGEKARVELNGLIDEIAADARFLGSVDGRLVACSHCPQPAWVWADRDALHSALDNIVGNALRYSPRSSILGIQVTQEAGLICLRISDEGPGVPEAELERIFEPFYRVSSARGRKDGGAGLGLAIAARVVSAHGGVLRARNLRPSGLEVLLQLPAAQPQPCASAGVLAISSGLASQSSGPGAAPWSSEG